MKRWHWHKFDFVWSAEIPRLTGGSIAINVWECTLGNCDKQKVEFVR